MVQGSRVKGRGYQQLIAWQRSHQLALAVFRATRRLARTEGWLRSQCARSAVSVAANIAEGYSRGTLKEYIRFLDIARGSLAETEYHLLFMHDAGLLGADEYHEIDQLVFEAGNVLFGLIRSLRAKEQAGDREPRRIGDEHGEYLTGTDAELADLDPRPPTPDPLEAT